MVSARADPALFAEGHWLPLGDDAQHTLHRIAGRQLFARGKAFACSNRTAAAAAWRGGLPRQPHFALDRLPAVQQAPVCHDDPPVAQHGTLARTHHDGLAQRGHRQ